MKANNEEAKSLILASQELVHQAEHELSENDAKACENIAKYVQLREKVIEKSIKQFYTTYQQIKNCSFEGADITHEGEDFEDIKENFYTQSPKIEPLEISYISTSGFSSVIVGVIYSLITLAILLAIGIIKSGSMVYLDAVPTLEMYQPILNFYGELIAKSDGTPLIGLGFIAGVSIFVGLFFAMIRYHGRSSKNLQHAKKTFEQAQEHKAEKDIQNEKILTLCEFTHKIDSSVHSLNVYLEEYHAVMKRIIHVEGDDYNHYTPLSRQKIQTAIILYHIMQKIMHTNIVTDGAEVNPESHHELSLAKHYLEAIKHGELGNYDETVYEDAEESQEEDNDATHQEQESHEDDELQHGEDEAQHQEEAHIEDETTQHENHQEETHEQEAHQHKENEVLEHETHEQEESSQEEEPKKEVTQH
jgi:hypothetical protein